MILSWETFNLENSRGEHKCLVIWSRYAVMIASLVLAYYASEEEKAEGGRKKFFVDQLVSFHGLRKLIIPGNPRRLRRYRVSALLSGIKASPSSPSIRRRTLVRGLRDVFLECGTVTRPHKAWFVSFVWKRKHVRFFHHHLHTIYIICPVYERDE